MSRSVTGHLHLWRSVAAIAIADAGRAILDRDHGVKLEKAVECQMRYFRGRNWKDICELAGISYKPDAVQKYLSSDMVQPTPTLIRKVFGLGESHEANGDA